VDSHATQLLLTIENGHALAADELLPLVYRELRNLAEGFLAHERSDHTLQPTALVHEAYLKLVNQNRVQWQGRAHFYAVAAQAMRRILINHAEKHRAHKRGGGVAHITLSDSDTPAPDDPLSARVDLLALNEALLRLERLDERQCRVVELRFFGGLSVDEAAHVLNISPRLVKLDWQMAKAWLYQHLYDGGDR
jgi:RNA polymerase sigma factor (TIGR02999 family)